LAFSSMESLEKPGFFSVLDRRLQRRMT